MVALKRFIPLFIVVLLMSATTFTCAPLAFAAELDDRDSLQGLTEVRPLFDLNVSNPDELLFYLKVIQQTVSSLQEQKQKIDCIVAIRGGAVRLVTTENWSFDEEEQQKLRDARARIDELARSGVKFEACSVAMGLFKVDPATLLPTVKGVGNTFISLIGYQSKGYVIVPVK